MHRGGQMAEEKAELQILKDAETSAKWFFSEYERLKERYGGNYVVVEGRHIVLEAKNLEDLQKNAKKKGIDIASNFVYFIPLKEVLASL